MRGRGGGTFGRRPQQQPLASEPPESFARLLFPKRPFHYFPHRVAPAKRSGGGEAAAAAAASLTIPSIDPSRVENSKPVPVTSLLAHPCTIFAASLDAAGGSAPNATGGSAAAAAGASANGAMVSAAAGGLSAGAQAAGPGGARGLRSDHHAPHMCVLSPPYYYTTRTPTPGCGPSSGLTAVAAAATSGERRQSGAAGAGMASLAAGGAASPLGGRQPSGVGGPHGGAGGGLGGLGGAGSVAAPRPAPHIVSSILTSETAERVASLLPPELILTDAPSTWRIRPAKRKRVEKPVRRGGVVTAAPTSARKPTSKSAKKGGKGGDEDGEGGAAAREGSGSRSGSEAKSDGDTDELSSIEGGGDDDDAGVDEGGGSDDELTM